MSIQVNSRPRDFCPAECRFMKLSVDSEIAWGDNKAQMITNIVSCEYEDVCKMWADREAFIKEPDKEAEWFVMVSQDLDNFSPKVTAKCSACGYIHNVTRVDAKDSLMDAIYRSKNGMPAIPDEFVKKLPTTCPECHSKMIFRP